MSIFFAEFFAMAILILLGNGVVANVLLANTKGHNSGLIVIATGWAIAVFTGVFISAPYSGAHLNPAVTVAFAMAGKTEWQLVPVYCSAQMLGAIAGQVLVWLTYRDHYEATTDGEHIRASFCNTPAIRKFSSNLLTETLATFVLVAGIFYMTAPNESLGSLDALPVALLVLGIGLSLGGPTGYAINPARDLGPRIAHAFLPIRNKTVNDWQYSWIPVVGPIAGGILAAVMYGFIF